MINLDDKFEIDLFNQGIKSVIESPEAPLIIDQFTSFMGDLSEKASQAKDDINKSMDKEINDAFTDK